jgi:hypothetical protein
MRASWRVIGLAAGAISLSLAAAASAAASTQAGAVTPARPAGSWGRAIEVPGLGALNADRFAEVLSVSCGSAGNCAAGGYYRDRRGKSQGFVAVERNSRWGTAIEVPGLGALNAGGAAEVLSVSCGSAGNCTAGGYYTDGRGRSQGFVDVERDGHWGRAIEVPGLGALNAGGFAEVSSVSCGSAGSCAAGGQYGIASGSYVGFVAVERDGRWGTAIEVPGLRALNKLNAPVTSVSCTPAGTCAAGGWYIDRHQHSQGFVVAERNGRWGTATELPGLAALNAGGGAEVSSVSCASAGNCAAGGDYSDRRSDFQGFVAVERDGRWGTAIEVPGLAALNKGGEAFGDSVSCPSAGNCAVGGTYLDGNGQFRWFVASQRNGAWGKAIQVPGVRALPRGDAPGHEPLSCASAGNCAVGGEVYRRGRRQVFVAVERDGRWDRAIEVPGLAALNKDGLAFISSVSCASARSCAAGGAYTDGPRDSQGFVVSRTG